MRYVNPPGQVYTMSALFGAGVGSIDGPNDGSDTVSAATVNQGFSEIGGTLAYLAASIIGINNAPPNAQPYSLAGTSGQYGVQRIARAANLAALAAGHANDSGSVAYVLGTGLYSWVPTRSLTPSTYYVINDDGGGSAPGQWIHIIDLLLTKTSAGSAQAGLIPELNPSGVLDPSLLPPGNSAVSTSCGTGWTNATNSPTDVTNLAVSVVSKSGRPIVVVCQPDGLGSPAGFVWANPSGGEIGGELHIVVGGSGSGTFSTEFLSFVAAAATTSTNAQIIPPATVCLMYPGTTPGLTYTFKVQGLSNQGSVNAINMVLAAYEI